jgi:indole-3-glycerol phosphate synthase
MDRLAEIMANKRQRLEATKTLVDIEQVREEARLRRQNAPQRALRRAVRNEAANIIAEFKRQSPSKGAIRVSADPVAIAKSYQQGGAAAISVLTEEDFFAGSLDDLRAIRETVSVPVLRKDFIFEDYQIYEAAVAGADAVLLIVAALEDDQLVSLRELAEEELGIDALVEVHDSVEMKLAVSSGAKLIGVNNRDLRTFRVSLETSIGLAEQAPKDAVLISESGLGCATDLRRLRAVGYSGFLIGESLMRSEDPEELLRSFLG